MKPASKKIYKNVEDLQKKVDIWKFNNQKVVFTNGCFDILHLGHVDYLEKSAALGKKLIVAVNSDASVRKLNKGKERPINDEYARMRVLAALGFVDAVVLFGEPTPLEVITTLKPSVLVKGNDYSVENIVGADVVIKSGGEVKTIELVEGYSTTKIINKILNG
ncbi:D-glycero-beta-D-manno-heptose 1-phosphate adenylyltransferase [Bernardetia sp. ABR2-2B]|uniref:D-glycero-beta-D-manno-heptose 1-phosphate adenylyltransferase n=1 Tax=Bernardetia sp. ABR2-2B TaxID=3127472 RepID=UPI0030CEB77F